MPPRTRAAAKDDAQPSEPAQQQPETHEPDDHQRVLLSLPPRFARAEVAQPDDAVVLPAPRDMARLGLVRIMTPQEYGARLARLVAPFPASQMEKLPRQLRRDDQDKGRCDGGSAYSADGYACGGWHARSVHLTYIGHAGITMRLLEVDPLWEWNPVTTTDRGEPVMNTEGCWITLTVLGMTRLGYADASGKRGANAVKEVIGDGLRNAALRFGVGTYLWSKSEEAQVLTAGGEVGDDAQPQRQQPQQPARRQQPRAQAAQPAQQQHAATMDAVTALAYRSQIIAAVDETQPGAERDERLRELRDAIGQREGLGCIVPLPAAWGDGDVTLYQLIIGGRGERRPSELQRSDTPDDYDPWATDPGAQGGPTDEQ